MVSSLEFDKEVLVVQPSKLPEKEQLTIIEIGLDDIDSASSFVSYLSEMYGFPKSSMWYDLRRLKEKGLVDFAAKGEKGKALRLTEKGIQIYKGFSAEKMKIINKFASKFIDEDSYSEY
ncbi:MarR family transcriptional regulator [Candidatus Mancarchaeum acidiphilum]|nr:MarR family transcriptional regulator [Candidatus Mancarchaeum acidiphilum]